MIISQARFRGCLPERPQVAGQEVPLEQILEVSRGRVNAGQDVEHLAIGVAEVGGDIAMQRTRNDVAVAEVDLNERYGANTFPDRFETPVDHPSHVYIREQHGSRQARVRSAELVVELSHHLKEE